MEYAVMAFVIVGIVVSIVGSIWFLIETFRESIWWGLGCLFISPLELVFLILHWDVAKRPFGIQLLGLVLLVAANLAGSSIATL